MGIRTIGTRGLVGLALAATVFGATGGIRSAHAGDSSIYVTDNTASAGFRIKITPYHCYGCWSPKPAISVSDLVADPDGSDMTAFEEVDPSAATLDIAGTNFVPNDPLQVALLSQDASGSVQGVGECATGFCGAPKPRVVLAAGGSVTDSLGQFAINLIPDPNSPVRCSQDELLATLVVTDQTTGVQVSTLVDPTTWWQNNAAIAGACPTDTQAPATSG